MFLAVTISIAVLFAVPVVASVFSVSIVITVFPFFHVEPVDDGTQVRKFVAQTKILEQGIVGFMRIVGTSYINGEVGYPCDDLCVGDQPDGGGVEYHVVEVPFQNIDGLHQSLACQQLGGVGRDCSTGEDTQVG